MTLATAKAQTLIHDIKSPLTALKLSLSSLSLPDLHEHIVRESFHTIENIMQQLQSLSGQGHLRPSQHTSPTQIYSIIQKLLPYIRQKAAYHKIHLSLVCPAHCHTWPCALGPLEFERAFMNLINNAFDALAEQEEASLIINIQRQQKHILLSVQDNGKGIAADKLSLLAQYGKTFDKKGGQGLGLYQVKNALESIGGQLIIDSQEGFGTTASMLFPILSETQTQLAICA